MKRLEQTVIDMENAYSKLMEEQKNYDASVAYRDFLMARGSDLTKFKNLVSNLNANTCTTNVVSYLKEKGAESKFLQMAQDPKEHFQVTSKLKTLMSFGY